MAESISFIKNALKSCPENELAGFITAYKDDERVGVIKLVEQAERRSAAFDAELKRVEGMREYENKYSDCEYICGVDEVGRGPLAGPVCAGAVILPKDCLIPYVNDSKKLTAAKREELSQIIMERAISVGFGSVDNVTIDKVNIRVATFMAMKQAIEALSVKPDIVLVDGLFTIPDIDIRQEAIVKGDGKSISIASASIVAKVMRDNYMTKLASTYPRYRFDKNKGYGSAEHMEALEIYGLSPVHRKTFIHLD